MFKEKHTSVFKEVNGDITIYLPKILKDFEDSKLASCLMAFKNYDCEKYFIKGIKEYIDSDVSIIDLINALPLELFKHKKTKTGVFGRPLSQQQIEYNRANQIETSETVNPLFSWINKLEEKEKYMNLLTKKEGSFDQTTAAWKSPDGLKIFEENSNLIKAFLKELLLKDGDKFSGLFSILYSFIGIDYDKFMKYMNNLEIVKTTANGKYQFNRELVVKHICIITQIFMEQIEKISINFGTSLGTIFTYAIFYFVYQYTNFYTPVDRNNYLIYLQIFSNIFLKIYPIIAGFHIKGYRGHKFIDDSNILFLIEVLHPHFYDLPSNYYSIVHGIHKNDIYQSCLSVIEKIRIFSKDLPYYLGKIPWLSKDEKTFGIPRINEYLQIRAMEILSLIESMDTPDVPNYKFKITDSINPELSRQITSPSIRKLYNKLSEKGFENSELLDDRFPEKFELSNNSPLNIKPNYTTAYDKDSIKDTKDIKKIQQIENFYNKLKNSKKLNLGTYGKTNSGDDGDKFYLGLLERFSRSKDGRQFLKTINFYDEKVRSYEETKIIPSNRKMYYNWPSDFEIEDVKKQIIINYDCCPRTYEDIIKYMMKYYPAFKTIYNSKIEKSESEIQSSVSKKITNYQANNILREIVNHIKESTDLHDMTDLKVIKQIVSEKLDQMAAQSKDFVKFIKNYFEVSSEHDYKTAVNQFKNLIIKKIYNKTEIKTPIVEGVKDTFLKSKYGRQLSDKIQEKNDQEILQYVKNYVEKLITKDWIEKNISKEDLDNMELIKNDIIEEIIKNLRYQKEQVPNKLSLLDKWFVDEIEKSRI
jgi:hypothetical protein